MAIALNGSTQYYDTGSAVVAGVPLSMAAWFYHTNTSLGSLVNVSRDQPTGAESYRSLEVTGGHIVQAHTRRPGSVFAASSVGGTINTWHHACGVWASVSDRRAYLDGGNKGTDTNTGTPFGLNRTSVGRVKYVLGDISYFAGRVAEAAVWDAALTDAEVASLAAGFSPLLIRPESLVDYWPFIKATSPTQDPVGKNELTGYNTPTVADHPRIILPAGQSVGIS